MSTNTLSAKDRIEQLLWQLKYEVERGLVTEQVGEDMEFTFLFPQSREIEDGWVHCQFRMKPVRKSQIFGPSDADNPAC